MIPMSVRELVKSDVLRAKKNGEVIVDKPKFARYICSLSCMELLLLCKAPHADDAAYRYEGALCQ